MQKKINMALKRCGECGNPVSEFADKCPNCGAPKDCFVDDDYNEGYPKKERNLKWFWVAIAIGIVVGIIGFTLYSEHQKGIKLQRLEKLRADSIAEANREAAERAAAERDEEIQDSINKVNFRNSFIILKDLLVLKSADWYDGKYPDFRSNIPAILKSRDYKLVNTYHDKREGEGGDLYPFTITTWEKKWDGADSADIWSRVKIDDGPCGGIEVYFCDNNALNAFLNSCRIFGYTHKTKDGSGGYELTMVAQDSDEMNYAHENYNCVISVTGRKVFISQGCI